MEPTILRVREDLGVPSLLLLSTVALFILWGAPQSTSGLLFAVIVVAAIVCLVVAATFRSVTARVALFDPQCFPLVYTTSVLLLPLLYIAIAQRPIGSSPMEMLSWPVAMIGFGYICGYSSGLILARLLPAARRKAAPDEHKRPTGGKFLRDSGRALLATSLIATLYQISADATVFSRVYGADQLAYTDIDAIGILAEVLLLPGAIAVMSANCFARNRPMTAVDWFLLAGTATLQMVLLGNRGAILAPTIAYFWYRSKSSKPIGVRQAVIVLLAGIIALSFIGVMRTGEQFDPAELVNRVFADMSSPNFIAYNITEVITSESGFYLGSTYIAAFRLLLPGLVRQRLGIEVEGTGSLAFRELIGYTNENHGFGFSMTAEAYMNFGLIGVVGMAALLSLVLQRSFDRTGQSFLTWGSMIYPTLIAWLPYGFRTDFLGFIKGACYPLLLLGIIVAINRMSNHRANQKDRQALGLQSRLKEPK